MTIQLTDANDLFGFSCSSGRAANLWTLFHWTCGSNPRPRNHAEKCLLLIIPTNHRAHLFHRAELGGGGRESTSEPQCSFTGFLISVPHEGTFMLMTGDSTSQHYCNPHLGILSVGVNKDPQQQNHKADKTVTNWQSHVRNTQWYLLSGPTSSHTLIMINIQYVLTSPTAWFYNCSPLFRHKYHVEGVIT